MDKPGIAPHQPAPRVGPAGPSLRGLLALDGLVFLMSALLNFGVRIPIGVATLGYPSPVVPAAVGEIVIGSALLAAAWTGRASHGWIAAVAAALGIAFGLSSPAVVGPARDIHLLLVPLTALVVLLLAVTWARRPRGRRGGDARRSAAPEPAPLEGITLAVAALMAMASVAYATASLIHFGLVIALGSVALRDPFPGAAAPEALIAIVLLACGVAVARRLDGAWLAALLGSAFSGLLTLFGLTITLRASRPGDVVYHLVVLALVAVILALVLLPATRDALGRRRAGVMQ